MILAPTIYMVEKRAIMKTILYCMHVGWNWIKQRPHYIAEELSNYYNITVLSDYTYRGRIKTEGKQKESNGNLHIKNFYKIPMLDHYAKTKHVNELLRKHFYNKNIIEVRPDYIYVMTPSAVNYIPTNYNGKLIYDCMDDMLEFTTEKRMRDDIAKNEKRLVRKADVILVSSNNLKNVLCRRYGKDLSNKITLVRNGYSGEISEVDNDKNNCERTENKKQYTLCYFGTIANWFDFDLVRRSLDEIPNLSYKIIGPVQAGTNILQHDRINYIGSVPHDDLKKYIADVDALIMPFKVTELIKSVDPVKLYEYINFDKNILCVEYPEVERFRDFVYFYNDYDSYKTQIVNMMNNSKIKYSNDQRVKFLNNNTWPKRAEVIEKSLEKL